MRQPRGSQGLSRSARGSGAIGVQPSHLAPIELPGLGLATRSRRSNDRYLFRRSSAHRSRTRAAASAEDADPSRSDQQANDDQDDAVEHRAADQVTIPPITQIAAMIHRIVATPPPQSLAATMTRSRAPPFRRSRSTSFSAATPKPHLRRVDQLRQGSDAAAPATRSRPSRSTPDRAPTPTGQAPEYVFEHLRRQDHVLAEVRAGDVATR